MIKYLEFGSWEEMNDRFTILCFMTENLKWEKIPAAGVRMKSLHTSFQIHHLSQLMFSLLKRL